MNPFDCRSRFSVLVALCVLSGCDASKKSYDECVQLHAAKKLDEAELACMQARGKTDNPTTKYGKLAQTELEAVRQDQDVQHYDAAVAKLQAEAVGSVASLQLPAQQKLKTRATCETATHARCFGEVGVSAMSNRYSKE